RLARSRRAAAHIDRCHRRLGREDHGDPGPGCAILGIADANAVHVGDQIVRAGPEHGTRVAPWPTAGNCGGPAHFRAIECCAIVAAEAGMAAGWQRRMLRVSALAAIAGALPASNLGAATLPPVAAQNGMVVAEQRLAAETGAGILAAGGNAVDAAV